MTKNNNKRQQEYTKLLELQNLKKESLLVVERFAAQHPYSYRLEEQYIKDPKIQPQRSQRDELMRIFGTHAKNFELYREKLERKYKFEFPVQCYGDTTFAEYFKDTLVEVN